MMCCRHGVEWSVLFCVCSHFICFFSPRRQRRPRWSQSKCEVNFVFNSTSKKEGKLTEVCVAVQGEIFHFFVLFRVFFSVIPPLGVVLLPTPWPFVWPPKGRLSHLLSAGCSLAVSDSLFFFFWFVLVFFFFLLHSCAQKCHCFLFLSPQANGIPDSAPSHQHGKRLLLEVDQRLCRLCARLQAQLWRSEGSPCVCCVEWSGVDWSWQW